MAVLDRSDLEASPLADLHAIAGELGLDGYRRLRKAELIDRILERAGADAGEERAGPGAGEVRAGASVREERAGPDASEERAGAGASEERAGAGAREVRAGAEGGEERAGAGLDFGDTDAGTARAGAGAKRTGADLDGEQAGTEAVPSTRRRRSSRRRRGSEDEGEQALERGPSRPGRGRVRRPEPEPEPEAEREAEELGPGSGRGSEMVVAGIVEMLANGSAFLHPDDGFEIGEDVYISAAQVRRCELVGGDRVGGPVRTARGSERHPSLVRVDTINGEPATTVVGRPKFDSLPAAFPSERLVLGSDDPTLQAIEWLTPIGRGSRVAIVGAPRCGKTETLRLLLAALASQEGLQISLVLAGARPEEVRDWEQGPISPATVLTLAAGPDAQGQAVEGAVEAAKRLASRGEHVLLAIDGLDGVPPHIARRALAAARNILDGGSLTVIATASEPFGGESTVIALDALRTSTGRLPALDLLASGTLKAELLVGEESAAEIVRARAQAAAAHAV